MPAIHPARLKLQAAILAEHFDDPSTYVRSLHHLLEAYAEHILRPGQVGEPPPLLAAYHVRPPVLRYILRELIPLAQGDPVSGLALCDALWERPYLEFRLLAAHLLGQIPCDPVEPILGRLKSWIKPDVETRLLDALFTQGMSCISRCNPLALTSLADQWLKRNDVFYQQLGLRLLLPLVSDPRFENLPVFYQLIQPLTRSSPAQLRPDLLDILAALAHRSPNETVYFLRQAATQTNSPDTPFLIRQVRNEFPPDQQESLRSLLAELGPQALK